MPEQIARLKQHQNLIVCRLKHGVPKALNWSKLYEVKQNCDESSPEFLNRLREAAIKYTNLDRDSTDGKAHLVFLFMGQATHDIRRKLQKVDEI